MTTVSINYFWATRKAYQFVFKIIFIEYEFKKKYKFELNLEN